MARIILWGREGVQGSVEVLRASPWMYKEHDVSAEMLDWARRDIKGQKLRRETWTLGRFWTRGTRSPDKDT